MAKTQDTPTPTPDLTDTRSSFRLDSGSSFWQGRYKILEFIGQGGMGQVYKAHDSILERNVAIKLLTLSRIEGPIARRFQLEAKATSTLKNEGIIEIYDFGINEDGFPFMVMEFIEGETLHDHLKNVFALNQIEALALTKQICEAMQHAHEHEIVHRDLKPANIILTEGEIEEESENEAEIRIKILDFGISKLLFEDEEEKQYLTQTGQIIGSPRYLSPEQALDGPIDHRTDIYSIGCILFELLTGSAPFEGETAIDIIHAHLEEEPPLLRERSDYEFPEELEALVAKCLMKKPEERFQTVSDLLKEIESIGDTLLKEQEESEVAIPSPRKAPKSGPNKLVLIAVPLVLLLLAAGLTAFFLSKNNVNKKETHQKLKWISEDIKETVYETDKPEFYIENNNFYVWRDIKRLDASSLTTIDWKTIYGMQIKRCQDLDASFLEEASKHHVEKLEIVDTPLSRETFQVIPKIKTLHTLMFKDANIEVSDLDSLKHLNLVAFTVEKNKNIETSGIRKIIKIFPRLVQLDIGGTSVKGKDLQYLKKLKRLGSLDLQDINLKDEDLKYIKDIPNLYRLVLEDNRKLTVKALYTLKNKRLKVMIEGCTGMDPTKVNEFIRNTPNVKVEGDPTRWFL